MSRPLVVSFLLLAAVANAGAVRYDCGYTTGCDDCLINKDVNAKETVKFGECKEKTVNDQKVYYMYECDKDGAVSEVHYYDAECKIKENAVTPKDYTCGVPEGKETESASVELVKGAAEDLSLKYCKGTDLCKADEKGASCLTGTIKKDAMSGACTKGDGFSFKATKLAGGDYVLSISGYSGDTCEQDKLLFQGVFVAGKKECTRLRQVEKYVCDAAAHYTSKKCGLVQTCGDCSESTEDITVVENVCENSSEEEANWSSMSTCSGGKVTYTTYSDAQCSETVKTATRESCTFSGTAQYVKLVGSALYMCSSMKLCRDDKQLSGCLKRAPANFQADGECVYDEKGDFSYKATQSGDKYRIAVFNSKTCDKGLAIQGEFGSECTMTRGATKTECSSSFAVNAAVAASVIAAAMALLF